MLSRVGLSSCFALCRAASPHAYQSTGLCACCSKYGLVSLMSRLVCLYCGVAGAAFVVSDMIPPGGRNVGYINVLIFSCSSGCCRHCTIYGGQRFFSRHFYAY